MASSSGRQPNFAALNRGRHLCSAGRPSGWALAHILVVINSYPLLVTECMISDYVVHAVCKFLEYDDDGKLVGWCQTAHITVILESPHSRSY